MLKLATALGAALLVLSSALAQTPIPPSAKCVPVGVTVSTSPAPESGRLEGDALVKFRVALANHLANDASPLPADADLMILFKINDKITAFAFSKGGCTLGTGAMPNTLITQLRGSSI